MAVALASERSRAAAFISILFKVEISGGTGGGISIKSHAAAAAGKFYPDKKPRQQKRWRMIGMTVCFARCKRGPAYQKKFE